MKLLGRSEFELSSGRRFCANLNVIGLHVDTLEVSEGSDGPINTHREKFYDEDDWKDWTTQERHELATFMIERWLAFAFLRF